MTEPLYELAFYGRLVDGVSLEAAKSNVTRLFKASAAQVDKMFAGGRVVIRNKLDRATADKYVAVMRKNGLVCEVDVMGAAAKPAPSAPKPSVAAKPSVAPKPAAAPSSVPTKEPAKEPQTVSNKTSDGLKILPLPSSFSVPDDGSESHTAGFNLAGDKVDGILQSSHLNLDPEGARLSEHHEDVPPVFSELDSISIAPTGTDLADKIEEIPPIVPDVSSISLAPTGTDMGELKKDEHIEVPDLSHLKLDD